VRKQVKKGLSAQQVYNEIEIQLPGKNPEDYAKIIKKEQKKTVYGKQGNH